MLVKYADAVRRSPAFGVLSADIAGGRLNHTYLFVTADEAAKESLIKLTAAELFCARHPACLKCADCIRALSGAHPDLHRYPEKGAKIVVADIDALVADISVMSYSGGCRVYVLDKAETMNIQAQNKLLKTLEETPDNAVILIFAANDSCMLPTVKSRVRTIRMGAFAFEDILAALPERIENRRSAAELAHGSFFLAEKIASSQAYREMDALVFDMLSAMTSSPAILPYANKIAAYRELIPEFLGFLAAACADLINFKCGAQYVLNKTRINDIIVIEKNFSINALCLILDKINHSLGRLNLFGNAQSVVDELLFYIVEVKIKCR
ncbi:MAG: hypothetical protein LBS99_06135 [Clostridiales bacterium]|jgi:DNA polymerase-3 subunit delta'|nr:hypothetical protein [Clostridiales bacterium]